MRLECPHDSFIKGVEPVMIEINIPVLIAAPHAPQNPQAPPGTLLPLLIISLRAFERSISPPALWYAVRRDAPTMIWCSGPCIWQNGISIIFPIISIGSHDVSFRHNPTIESTPLE
jgi:hypothetical protein